MFTGLICKDSSYLVTALDGVENSHVEQSAETTSVLKTIQMLIGRHR